MKKTLDLSKEGLLLLSISCSISCLTFLAFTSMTGTEWVVVCLHWHEIEQAFWRSRESPFFWRLKNDRHLIIFNWFYYEKIIMEYKRVNPIDTFLDSERLAKESLEVHFFHENLCKLFGNPPNVLMFFRGWSWIGLYFLVIKLPTKSKKKPKSNPFYTVSCCSNRWMTLNGNFYQASF